MALLHNKLKIILFIILSLGITKIYAQEITINNIELDLEFEDYKNLTLPPLDVLFENAKNAPAYELAQVEEEIERNLLKKEKKAFLGFFSLRGSWQYGNFTNDASYSDIVTPIINSYNKATQTSYSVGAGINIPLDQLFDLKGKVKRQKMNVRVAELQKEKEYELIKKNIIDLYAQAVSQLNTLKIRAEAINVSKAQYEIAERHFINGTISSDALSVEKERQSVSLQRYENSRFELNKSLMTLEVITQTPIIKK